MASRDLLEDSITPKDLLINDNNNNEDDIRHLAIEQIVDSDEGSSEDNIINTSLR